MAEREASAEILRAKQAQIEDRLGRVDNLMQNAGRMLIDKELVGVWGDDRIDGLIRIGERAEKIIARLQDKTRPYLLSQKQKVESQIETEGRLERIRGLVERGIIPREELEKLQRMEPEKAPESRLAEPGVEAEPLPTIRVNVAARTLENDGRAFGFRSNNHIAWKVFLALAKNPDGVGNREIAAIARAAGSKGNRPAGETVDRLRNGLESLGLSRDIIETIPKEGRGRVIYRLYANVEFAGLFEVDAEAIGNLSPLERKIIEELRFHSKENPAPVADLVRNIWSAEVPLKVGSDRLTTELSRIKRQLQPAGYAVLNLLPRGSSRGGLYYLEKVNQTVSAPAIVEEKPARKEFPKVGETRLVALSAILENPQISVDEVIGILGPNRKGRRLTWINADWALDKAARFLLIRSMGLMATEQEASLWSKIREQMYPQIADEGEASGQFRNYLKAWIRKDRGLSEKQLPEITKEQEEQVRGLTIDEAALLAAMFLNRKGLLGKEGIEAFPEDIAKSLMLKVQTPAEVSNLLELREKIVERLKEASTSGVLNTLFEETGDEDIQLLIVYFSEIEEKVNGAFMENLTGGPDTFWQEEMGRIVEIWKQWEKEKEPKPIPYVEPARKPKISDLEKKDPLVRERIREILGEIDESKLPPLVNVAQLSKLLPIAIRARDFDLAQEKGLLSIGKRRNRTESLHPRINHSDVAVLFYWKKYARFLTQAQARELTGIIEQEIARQEAKAN